MGYLIEKWKALIKPVEPFWSIIFVPIWQEFIFRYIPYLIFLKTNKFWLIGIVSSLLFASIHWYFKKWFLVFSFLNGIMLWWIMVSYGLFPAILVHSAIIILLQLLGVRKLAENSKIG